MFCNHKIIKVKDFMSLVAVALRSDEGLMLKTSAFIFFTVANLPYH